ncbi:hypothetical protein HanRHA438_Chr05g0236881 [Helianthus annuus]|uniref:Uncharacterized protein n=1 Tax=Helianthus annuus TaxID=4232 RepID=A0A9K3J1C1_HELAN|nr:hypothetical protein HanXRQr2_Chr05g0227751 [Helianthus annuus]KAJ0585510.1 hypothetical protein HanHA89_Chr05g0201151 [Helianthus annuus]KAJ0920075.1 hypothetical protein HanRHA438_Chr05g0236881 [Helianthus annuus]KAJ0923755.1 hypothetical protein HanPSC8_Chr05g0219781 [Helianthus annuus]
MVKSAYRWAHTPATAHEFRLTPVRTRCTVVVILPSNHLNTTNAGGGLKFW